MSELTHAFQAAKTLNQGAFMFIMSSATPGIAKSRGRKTILRADWEAYRMSVMRSCLRSTVVAQ